MLKRSKLARVGVKRAIVQPGRKPIKKGVTGQTSGNKRVLETKPKAWKFTKSKLAQADAIFSDYIRKRDGRCQFPGCHVTEHSKLQNSHYIGRGKWSTRFDEDNCIALCWHHHFKNKILGWEYQKQQAEEHGWDGRYTLHMKQWLGSRWEPLLARSKEKANRNEVIQAVLDAENLSTPKH